MQKGSLEQYESFYSELRQNISNIRDIDLLEWFVLSVLMAYEFSCRSSQLIPSHVNTILNTSNLTELQREYK